jgi:hypothetical protein
MMGLKKNNKYIKKYEKVQIKFYGPQVIHMKKLC